MNPQWHGATRPRAYPTIIIFAADAQWANPVSGYWFIARPDCLPYWEFRIIWSARRRKNADERDGEQTRFSRGAFNSIWGGAREFGHCGSLIFMMGHGGTRELAAVLGCNSEFAGAHLLFAKFAMRRTRDPCVERIYLLVRAIPSRCVACLWIIVHFMRAIDCVDSFIELRLVMETTGWYIIKVDLTKLWGEAFVRSWKGRHLSFSKYFPVTYGNR